MPAFSCHRPSLNGEHEVMKQSSCSMCVLISMLQLILDEHLQAAIHELQHLKLATDAQIRYADIVAAQKAVAVQPDVRQVLHPST